MRLQFFFFLLFLTLFITTGCSSLHVDADFDPAADFFSIHTYAWKKVKVRGDAPADNPLLGAIQKSDKFDKLDNILT
ncbi:MAG TPA: hypothetical protein ENK89_06350 [Desulfobulbaceae bacterium]|nr:hypothetical protein [Desulfobulbaceae bacterium]